MWVLIIYIYATWGPNFVATAVPGFTSEQTCTHAGEAMQTFAREDNNKRVVRYTCEKQ